jgi:hypothetical protein
VTSEDFRPNFITHHSSLITNLSGKAAQFVKVVFRQMNHAEKGNYSGVKFKIRGVGSKTPGLEPVVSQ